MRRLFWLLIGVSLALIAVAGATALSFAQTRHLLQGLLNGPEQLTALGDNEQVRYEAGGEGFAREVEKLLPAATAKIEATQGRAFEHPVTIGVYTTMDAFVAGNGTGSDAPLGVMSFGRVTLSPKLFGPQHHRLPAILTHELSHAHLYGWIGGVAYIYLPNWFKEGLAVMVSDGGGGEAVSEAAARAALKRGERIVVNDVGDFKKLTDVPLEKAPPGKPDWYAIVLAYREAGMFVTWLHDSDRTAFDRMFKAILEGGKFTDAVNAGYNADIQSLWQKFLAAN
ncbi:MAG TPA: hypothetical protein VMI56_12745 [Reyranella sp.]|nr:hypothetical protein [Reyranella sp.]